MNASRRKLLLASALVLPLAAGCSIFGSTPPTSTQIQDDVNTLVNGLSGIVTALTGIAPADVLAQIQTELDKLKADAAAIGAAVQPNQTTLQDISNAVGLIADLATPFFPAAGTVAMVVQAALAFLPTILGLFGLKASRIPHAQIVAVVGKPLSVAQARVILRGAAAGIAP